MKDSLMRALRQALDTEVDHKMRFEIIGSGSMGLLFGAKLLSSGHSVHFWTRSREQAERLTQDGLTLTCLDQTVYNLKEVTSGVLGETNLSDDIQANRQNETRYLMLAVKQTQINNRLLQELKKLMDSSTNKVLLVMQNGYGHLEKLEHIMECPIITMITSEAALRLDFVHIQHTGAGLTTIGDQLQRDFASIHQKNISNALHKAGFQVLVSKNIKEAIYSKLLANAVINPLTALFRITNGELPLDQGRLQLMEKLYTETKQILRFDVPELSMHQFDAILHICQATSTNRSSMLCDVEANAKTEIESINGAVVDIANKHGVIAPLNTSLLNLILALHPE